MADRKEKSSKNLRHLQSTGVYLAIVFEFLGMLGFSGLVAYALQRWAWPEHGPIVFLVTMMLGLAIGIWHIYLRTKGFSVERVRPVKDEEKRLSIEDGERSVEELRRLRRRLDDLSR